jgi:hypothetical protein
MTEQPLIIGKPEPSRKVEVCRSFSYKLNLKNADGSPTYEAADFFASRKMECALEDAEWISQQIFEECVAEVRESIRVFQEQRLGRRRAPKMEGAA